MTHCATLDVIERIALILERRKQRVLTVESCTGGGVAEAFTDLVGSSSWFAHGLVTYSNSAKMLYADVPSATLREHGAVSAATAKAMALGALGQFNTRLCKETDKAAFDVVEVDYALAITGIAGPGGGSADKPKGTVDFAWAHKNGEWQHARQLFAGRRAEVREQAVAYACAGLLAFIEAN